MIEKPTLVPVQRPAADDGKLGVVEAERDAGFVFKRFYFIYDVSRDGVRGLHAHKQLRQYMIALNGSFDIILKGKGRAFSFTLEKDGDGLVIPPGYWRELSNFKNNAICLVGASDAYDAEDYIEDYEEFLAWEK